MLVTAASFREPWEAHIFHGRLTAEGVPAFVAHEFHIWVNWPYATALGGVKVQVPLDWLDAARHIEQLCRDGEFRAILEAEFGKLDEITCRHCGATDHEKLRPIPRQLLAIMASFLTGTLLPAWGWIYACRNCCRRFKP